MKRIILPLLLCFIALNSTGQTMTSPILTDRPDQTETPSTVPPGHWQFEIGGLFQSDETGNYTRHDFLMPTVLTKYGLSKTLEFRLITELGGVGQMANNTRNFNAGIKPVIVGMKVNLFKENRKKFIPKTSFIGHLGISQLSTDVYNFNTNRAIPSFRFLMQHTLTEKTALGYNLGMEWNGISNTPSSIYTLSLARDLGKGFGGFAEFYGYFTRYSLPTNDIVGDHRFNAGLTYLANRNTQFDVSSGFGITDNAPDYFISAGVSFRTK